MKTISFPISILFGISVLILSACGGSQQNAVNENQSDTLSMVKDTQPIEQKYPMPTSFEITQMINKTGATYTAGITNAVESVDKYMNSPSRALNLGIYGADLAYASTYQKKQETMLYLEATKKLIDLLEITTSINESLVDKIENNIENKDILIKEISKSYYETYDFLTQNGRDNLSLLIIAGSWIEGLYLTIQVAIVTKNNPEIERIIAKQKNSLNDLINLLSPSAADPSVAGILADLNDLKVVYDPVNNDVSKEQLITITSKVESIRNKIIHL